MCLLSCIDAYYSVYEQRSATPSKPWLMPRNSPQRDMMDRGACWLDQCLGGLCCASSPHHSMPNQRQRQRSKECSNRCSCSLNRVWLWPTLTDHCLADIVAAEHLCIIVGIRACICDVLHTHVRAFHAHACAHIKF